LTPFGLVTAFCNCTSDVEPFRLEEVPRCIFAVRLDGTIEEVDDGRFLLLIDSWGA
jgi:hypothetical protein